MRSGPARGQRGPGHGVCSARVAPRGAGDATRRGGKQRGRKEQRRSSRRRRRDARREGESDGEREEGATRRFRKQKRKLSTPRILHGEYIFSFVDSVEKPKNSRRNDEKAGQGKEKQEEPLQTKSDSIDLDRRTKDQTDEGFPGDVDGLSDGRGSPA